MHVGHFVSLHDALKASNLFDPLLLVLLDIQEAEGVLDEARLHLSINLRIIIETGTLVDLEQPRLQLLVEHDVNAQDLETLSVVLVG